VVIATHDLALVEAAREDGAGPWRFFRGRTLAKILAVLGLIGGAYLGRMVGSRMLSFLNVDEDGRPAEPTFILQTDWLMVLAGAAIVLAVFAFALGIAGRLISRTSDAQALRTD